MPVLQPYLTDAVWGLLAPMLPPRPADTHPLGCHRPRVPDEVVFNHLLPVLVLGASYYQASSPGCSATTIRRWRNRLMDGQVGRAVEARARALYDEHVGLELNDLAIDGCMAKSPCGGETAGKSPVDRRKRGVKRSLAVDANGAPLAVVLDGANRNDCALMERTLEELSARDLLMEGAVVHVDRGYRGRPVEESLGRRGLAKMMPLEWGDDKRRWVVERTHSWQNNFGKLRRSTERSRAVLEFFVSLVNAIILLRKVLLKTQPWLVTKSRSCRP